MNQSLGYDARRATGGELHGARATRVSNSEITEALITLANTVEVLADLTAKLGDKLLPVRRNGSMSPETGKQISQSGAVTPIGIAIVQQRLRLAELTELVAFLLNDIEV